MLWPPAPFREDFDGSLSCADGFTFELSHYIGDKPPIREAFVISNMDKWQKGDQAIAMDG